MLIKEIWAYKLIDKSFPCLIFSAIFVMAVGIYTLYISPYSTSPLLSAGLKPSILIDKNVHNSNSEYSIITGRLTKVEGMAVENNDFLHLPEFSSPEEESRWWQRQRYLYEIIKDKKTLKLEFLNHEDGTALFTNLPVRDSMPFFEIIERTGLIYEEGRKRG